MRHAAVIAGSGRRRASAVLHIGPSSSGATLRPLDQRHAVKDDHLVRLHALTARLTQRIGEGVDVRARLTRAFAASAWPDRRSAARHLPLDVRTKD